MGRMLIAAAGVVGTSLLGRATVRVARVSSPAAAAVRRKSRKRKTVAAGGVQPPLWMRKRIAGAGVGQLVRRRHAVPVLLKRRSRRPPAAGGTIGRRTMTLTWTVGVQRRMKPSSPAVAVSHRNPLTVTAVKRRRARSAKRHRARTRMA